MAKTLDSKNFMEFFGENWILRMLSMKFIWWAATIWISQFFFGKNNFFIRPTDPGNLIKLRETQFLMP